MIKFSAMPSSWRRHCVVVMALAVLQVGFAAEPEYRLAAVVLMDKGDAVRAGGDRDGAEEAYRQALSLLEDHPDASYAELALCLGRLGAVLAGDGERIGEAVDYADRAESLLGKGEDGDIVSVMLAANLVSEIREAALDRSGTVAVLELAVDKARARGAVANDIYPLLVCRLAVFLIYAGDVAEGGVLLREAIEAGEKAWGRDGEKLHTPLAVHGAYLAVWEADFAGGAAALERALAIIDKTLGPDDPVAIYSLLELGGIRAWTGDYHEADRLLRKALSLAERLNPDGPETAGALFALAKSRYERGDFKEADTLAARSAALYERFGPALRLGLVNNLNLRALLALNSGDAEGAAGRIRQAIDLADETFGGESPVLILLRTNAAFIAGDAGRRKSAIREYELADRVAANVMEADNPMRLFIAGAIAEQRLLLGQAGAAERLLRPAWELAAAAPDHTAIQPLGNVFALACLANGRYGEALAVAVKMEQSANRFLASAFVGSSERQRLDFFGDSLFNQRRYAPLTLANLALLDIPEQNAAAAAYAAHVLQTKGAVLDSLLEDRDRLRGSPEAAALLERLRRDRRILATLLLHSPAEPAGDAARRIRIAELQKDIEQADRELADLAGRYSEGRRAARATPEAVAERLPAGTVLVELSEGAVWQEPGAGARPGDVGFSDARYFATIINPGAAPVRVVNLGGKREIDSLVGAVQAAMRRGRAVHDDLRRLHDLVWAPLLPHLGKGRRVFVSPAGELNFLSFAVLLTPEERYLGEEFTLSYLASGRDLLRRPGAGGVGAFVFADPDYAAAILDKGSRGGPAEPRCAVLSGLRLPRLPATRVEAEAIRRIFSAAGRPLTVWLGADASEARLKAVRGPDIVHFATHGFFVPLDGGGSAAAGDGRVPSCRDDDDSPLLRSGLALAGAAGARAAYSPRDGADDGIVTAEEVALLDLWGAKLAVVSACDSGTGTLVDGEGVMGLRRAFVQAGVRDLLLTLWPIEDKTTARIVEAFYQGYLAGDPLDEALAQAQRQEIRTARAAGKNAHPRFWAPFVVSFQGAPLE